MDNCNEAVCIQTGQIYDSCRDKECIENLRVYLCGAGQSLVDRAINVKPKKAELIWVFPKVEAVPFNKGFYTVDMKFFFKIELDVYTNVCTPSHVCGLASYNKKVVLFGSEGTSKIFSSDTSDICDFKPSQWHQTNMPKAVVSAVDPILLSAKLVDGNESCCCSCKENCCKEVDVEHVPKCVQQIFEDALSFTGEQKKVYISLGLFSIVKLQRDVQLLIPAYDFCIPDKECIASTECNPCELFEKLQFPIDAFFPPTKSESKPNCDC